MPNNDFEPNYCTLCHRVIPAELSLSQRICVECADARSGTAKAFEEARARAAAATSAAVESRTRAELTKNSGLGICSACGSRNIAEGVETSGDDGSGAQAGACCIGAFLFWPVLFLLPFLKGNQVKHRYRVCNICGHRWPI